MDKKREEAGCPEEELKQAQEETNSQPEVTDADDMAQETGEMAEMEPTIEERFARLNDDYLRLMAEYDNYRKRTLKEKSDLIRYGGEKTLKALLPIIDDLDLAMQNMAQAEDVEALRKGMELIYSKFFDFLAREGVKAIETDAVPFDEELHEAIAVVPSPSEEQKGKIMDCVKKGYTLHDKVMRHASVVVGQ